MSRLLVCCLLEVLLAASSLGAGPPVIDVDHLGDPLPPGAVARLGTLRFWHRETIVAVALSPDGRTVASAENTCQEADAAGNVQTFSRIHVWEAKTGKEQLTIRVADDPIRCLAFSTDGRTLAAACGKRVVLWNVAGGKEIRSWPEHQAGVASVVFLPDGKTLAIVEDQDRIHLWNLKTAKRVRVLKADKPKPALLKNGDRVEEFHVPTLSPDGKVVAWAITRMMTSRNREERKSEGHIKFCSVDTGRVRCSIPLRVGGVLTLDRTGTAAVATRSNSVEIQDTAKGTKRRIFQRDNPDLVGAALSPDGRTLAAGTVAGALLLWDTRTGKPLHELRLPGPTIVLGRMPLAFSRDGRSLVACRDSRIVVIDVATGKESAPLRVHGRAITNLRFSPDGKALRSGRLEDVRLWDTKTWKERIAWRPASMLKPKEELVAIAPDGSLLVSRSSPADDIQRRDSSTGKTLCTFAGAGPSLGALFSANGRTAMLLAAKVDHQTWTIHDMGSGKLLRRLDLDYKKMHAWPALSPCGRLLAWAANDGKISIMDIATGRISSISAPPPRRDPEDEGPLFDSLLFFSPDGERIATIVDEGDEFNGRTVRVWHIRTGKPIARWLLPEESGTSFVVTSAAFTSDGRTLAVGHQIGGAIYLWDVSTGRSVRHLLGHQAGVKSLAFSPNGRYLASGSADRTVLIWDLQSALALPVPPGTKPDGKELHRVWAMLADKDPVRARTAIQILTAAPRNSVPFLGARLKPMRAVEAKVLAALIQQMDSNTFARREKADRQLADLGEAAEGALRRARAKKPDLELHRRIDRLLARCMNPALSPDGLRDLRAIEVLERIADRPARQVLETLARGVPEARLTFEAKAALRRLQR